MSTADFIQQIASGDVVLAKESLNDLLSAKAFEALDAYKQELAKSIYSNEQESVQEEVEQLDELSRDTLANYQMKSWEKAQDKNTSPEKRGKRMMGITKSFGKQMKIMDREKAESAERRKHSKVTSSN